MFHSIKKKFWDNNLQGNEIFMYFGCNFESKTEHETTSGELHLATN